MGEKKIETLEKSLFDLIIKTIFSLPMFFQSWFADLSIFSIKQFKITHL